MSKSIRISGLAYTLLKSMAQSERRTVLAVVDAWLGVPAAEGSGVEVRSIQSGDYRPGDVVPLGPIHGIPEIIGTSAAFPVTTRDEYLGQPREPGDGVQVRSGPERSDTPVHRLLRDKGMIVPRETSDPWGALCGRCGHPKRAHLVNRGMGRMGRCGFGQHCGCRAFEPMEEGAEAVRQEEPR